MKFTDEMYGADVQFKYRDRICEGRFLTKKELASRDYASTYTGIWSNEVGGSVSGIMSSDYRNVYCWPLTEAKEGIWTNSKPIIVLSVSYPTRHHIPFL